MTSQRLKSLNAEMKAELHQPIKTERLPLPEPHHWLYHNKTGVSVVHWSKQQPRWLADKSAASAFPDAHWFFDSFTADQMHAYADAQSAADTAALRERIKVLEDALCGLIGAAAVPSADRWESALDAARAALKVSESVSQPISTPI